MTKGKKGANGATKKLELVFGYWAFLFIVWGLYRFLFRLPEELEEGILKPFIWLGPLFWLVGAKENRPIFPSLGFSRKNILSSCYWGIGLGAILTFEGLLINYLKYGSFSFISTPYESTGAFLIAFGLSLVTAFCEEVAFRGFMLNRLTETLKEKKVSNLLTSFCFTLIHFPAAFFVYHYPFPQIVIYFFLIFLASLVAGFSFLKNKNILAPILVHLFWWWPIILFR